MLSLVSVQNAIFQTVSFRDLLVTAVPELFSSFAVFKDSLFNEMDNDIKVSKF